MESLNNNISNSSMKTSNNVSSNSQKGEDSVFDKALDYAKTFFEDEEDSQDIEEYGQFASNNEMKAGSSGSLLDRLFLDSKANEQQKVKPNNKTYTLAPLNAAPTLEEQWAAENENVEMKQQEKEIQRLKDSLTTMKNKNKSLASQNTQIVQEAQQLNTQQTQMLNQVPQQVVSTPPAQPIAQQTQSVAINKPTASNTAQSSTRSDSVTPKV